MFSEAGSTGNRFYYSTHKAQPIQTAVYGEWVEGLDPAADMEQAMLSCEVDD